MAVVYIHTNLENGKVYVGQTCREAWQRWRDQRNEAMRGCLKSRHFQAGIRKYGWGSFEHQVVAEVQNQTELDNLEKVWIILLQSTNPQFGYNLTGGGEGGHPTVLVRERMSLAAKARPHQSCPLVTREKISAAQRGIPRPQSAATKDARKHSSAVLDHCRTLGAMHKGQPWSAARRAAQEGRV